MEFSRLEKIAKYIMDYHTADLVKMLLKNRDNKEEAVNVSAAIALRNGYKTVNPKTLARATNHTDHLIDKVQEKWYSDEYSDQRKKRKVARYCAAICIRNGIHDEFPTILKILMKVGTKLI